MKIRILLLVVVVFGAIFDLAVSWPRFWRSNNFFPLSTFWPLVWAPRWPRSSPASIWPPFSFDPRRGALGRPPRPRPRPNGPSCPWRGTPSWACSRGSGRVCAGDTNGKRCDNSGSWRGHRGRWSGRSKNCTWANTSIMRSSFILTSLHLFDLINGSIIHGCQSSVASQASWLFHKANKFGQKLP